MELWQLGVAQLKQGYALRHFSPHEVVESLLAQIAESDELIGAFRQVLGERATEEARRSSAEIAGGAARGALHGIPVAVKELIDVAGARGCYGSLVMGDRISTRDAEAVRRLRAAGAIVIGVTRSHEFGWGITTQHARLGGTRNPWNRDRVPGGSSGGSAAAVACGLAPLGLGTDTGGSIRIPAAYCGVVGLKPNFGRISRGGIVPLAPSLDHVGLLARSLQDAVQALPVLAGPDHDDPDTLPDSLPSLPPEHPSGHLRGLRIATSPGLHQPPLASDHQELFATALDALVECGAEIVEAAIGDVQQIRKVFAAIQNFEAYRTHTEVLGTYPSRAGDYGDDVRQRLQWAAGVTPAGYEWALETARAYRHRLEGLFETIHALVTPVAAGPPSLVTTPDWVEHLGQALPFRDLVMGYTVLQNITGLPAVVLPAGLDRAGLPVGVQVTGPPGREDLTLQIGLALEGALGPLGFPPSDVPAG